MHFEESPEVVDVNINVILIHSHNQPNHSKYDGAKRKDTPQLSVKIAKRGTPLPTLPKSVRSDNQLTDPTQPPMVSNVSKTSVSNIKLHDVSLPSFSSPYQTFDIIDHARKTKIQKSEIEHLQSNPDQFDRLVKFVKDRDSQPAMNSSQNNLMLSEPKSIHILSIFPY